jgi:HEAT repeat protein
MSTRPLPPLDSFEEASRPFVKALRGDDPLARGVALEEIAPIVDDALARELLRFARDPSRDPGERGRALIVLGPALEETGYEEEEEGGGLASPMGPEEWWETPLSDAGFREVNEELRRIYHDGDQPKEVRRRALEAAVRAPRDWHRDAVATAWRSGDEEWRVTAVFAMGFLSGFADEIEEAFRSDDPILRREAIGAVGRAEVEDLVPDLLEVAADTGEDGDDRIAAIEALEELQLAEAVDVLDDLLDDDDAEVARAAQEALTEISAWAEIEEGGFDLDDIQALEWDDELEN